MIVSPQRPAFYGWPLLVFVQPQGFKNFDNSVRISYNTHRLRRWLWLLQYLATLQGLALEKHTPPNLLVLWSYQLRGLG